MPTILSSAGIPIPADVQGQDLTPVLDNAETKFRTSMIGEIGNGKKGSLNLMYREGNWKYMYFSGGALERLYDLSKDPKELNDLSKAEPELCRKFKKELVNYYKKENYPAALDGDELIKTEPFRNRDLHPNSQYPRWPHNDPDMKGPKRASSMPKEK